MCCRALFQSTAFKTIFACLATQEPQQSGREQQQLCESQQCRKSNPESFVNGESAESVVVRRNPDSRPSTASAPTISNRDQSSLNSADNAVLSPRDSYEYSQKRDSQFPIAPKKSISFEANKYAEPEVPMEVPPVHDVPEHDQTGFNVENAEVPPPVEAADQDNNLGEVAIAEHQVQAAEEQPELAAEEQPMAHEVIAFADIIVPTATQALYHPG